MLRLVALSPGCGTEAGASAMRSVALRPLSGSSSIRSLSMTCPRLGLRVSTRGVAASTDTVSVSSPSPISMAISGFALTVSTMPVCWKVLNPDSIACRRYGPIGRLVKREIAVLVGHRRAREVGLGLRRADVDAGQHAAARVSNRSGDLSRGTCLGIDVANAQHEGHEEGTERPQSCCHRGDLLLGCYLANRSEVAGVYSEARPTFTHPGATNPCVTPRFRWLQTPWSGWVSCAPTG